MPFEVASAIRLGEAYFCLNCEVVTNCVDVCPACGHRRLWPLENWLGRVNGHENSRYKKPNPEEIHRVRTVEIAKKPSRRNYLQMVRWSNMKSRLQL